MKCCNCNATIPDESKFCLVCGAKQSMGKTCPNCGARELLEEAVFCPHCGQRVGIPHDARDLFFPLKGLTLGKTTMDDVEKTCMDISDMYDDESFYWPHDDVLKDVHCTRKIYERYVDHMFIIDRESYPLEWKKQHNVSFDSTFDEWSAFFCKYGFSVRKRHNQTTFFAGTYSLVAMSSNEKLVFTLLFQYKDNCLQNISIDYDEN